MDKNQREKELIRIIGTLESLLCDLGYEGDVLEKRIKKEENFCLNCYGSTTMCRCSEPDSCALSEGSEDSS
jgi:hypothetical protein